MRSVWGWEWRGCEVVVVGRGGFATVWIWAYYLVVGVVILTVFVTVSSNIVRNVYFNQVYESREVALIVDVLPLVPGEMRVVKRGGEGLTYKVGKGVVSVSARFPVSYQYAVDHERGVRVVREGEGVVLSNV